MPPLPSDKIFAVERPTAGHAGSKACGEVVRPGGVCGCGTNRVSRAIVVHSAWYVSEEMAGIRGMLGRSQVCFAVAGSSLDDIMTRLGPGRLIYAGKA
jgi:hypothetical protein